MNYNISKIKKAVKEKYHTTGNAIIHINEECIPEMIQWFPDGSNIDREQVEGEFKFTRNLWDNQDVNQTYFTYIDMDKETGEIFFKSLINLNNL